MKAIQMTTNGDADVLTVKNLETPKPGKGQALVKLKAAGLNFIDIYMRKGHYPRELPFTPGLEGAGVVEAVGEGVTDIQPGDRVAYTGCIGSYAEYNVVDAFHLIPLPDEITFEQGAAFPLQGMTAQYLVHDFYNVTPGTNVLVHAAAGGVGLLLVQWLHHLKANVIGTASTEEKMAAATAAGANHMINYSKQDFVAEVKKLTNDQGADYIIDGVGKTTFTQDLDAVRVYGHVCIFGSASGPAEPLAPNFLQQKSITVSGGSLFNCANSREELLTRANAVLEGMKAGWLQLKIDHVFSLEEAAQAQVALEGRKTSGKVILTMD